jgi:hypothetical protein
LDKNDFTEGISKRQFSGESLIFLWFFGLKPHLLTKKRLVAKMMIFWHQLLMSQKPTVVSTLSKFYSSLLVKPFPSTYINF